MLLIDYIKGTPLYHELTKVHNTNEGNLLELTNPKTLEAQVEFMRWALPQMHNRMLLEIGTNKGMFGLLASYIVPGCHLITVDINPDSAKVEEIMRQNTNITVEVWIGNSIELIPAFEGINFGFAWIDGNHDYEYALSDLRNVARLGVPLIAIDDTNYKSVMDAINIWLVDAEYEEVPNPFIQYDDRKARLFKRKG